MTAPGVTLIQRWDAVMATNYRTPPIALVRGLGAQVWDEAGRSYLDLVGGIATNVLGHAHPAVVEAVSRQVATLGHSSNLVVNEPGILLAERLLDLVGRPGRVFFCNSGAEANEAAFKVSRLTGRPGIVAALGAFHGRTMGALALTGQPEKAAAFAPLPGGVTHVPYGDTAALEAAVDETTAMVVLEPILGEGGVVAPPPGYLADAEATSRSAGSLFALDEVQTGMGRTGAWFAHSSAGVEPDVITLAKALGGGLPIGAMLAFGGAADLLQPGSHGSTFGGNPISCAAALAVIDTIVSEDLLGRAKHIGEFIAGGVAALARPVFTGVRGAGALLAITLSEPRAAEVERALRTVGFLVNAVAPDAIRLAPPLVITDEQLGAFLEALGSITMGSDTMESGE
ncbi:MAG: acetylornithine transaminase [Geodermatophilaceae bacterium]|nr:acetylornithine transaminase [Geodermatophilaceae bacterium]